MFRLFIFMLLSTFSAIAAELEIIHINVGQGDSTLIIGPEDSAGDRVTVLMDSGDRGAGGNLDGGIVVGEVLTPSKLRLSNHLEQGKLPFLCQRTNNTG